MSVFESGSGEAIHEYQSILQDIHIVLYGRYEVCPHNFQKDVVSGAGIGWEVA